MKICTPSPFLRLSVIERLLRCRFWKSGPSLGPPIGASSPGGDSILITSAPKSASWRTQVGPARTRERSRMRKRERAVEAGTWGMAEDGVADRCDRYDNLYGRRRNDRSRTELERNPRRRGEALRELPDGILARARPRAALPDRVRERDHRPRSSLLPHSRGLRRRAPAHHRRGAAPGAPQQHPGQR